MTQREVVVRTGRGFDRLVNFTDATIAIAITLLILPIMDGLSEEYAEGGVITDVPKFLANERSSFVVFFVTFFIMFWLWWINHKTFEKFRQYDFVLVALSFMWVVSMVVLAFPVDLAYRSDSNLAYALFNFACVIPLTLTAVINLYGRARPHMLSDQPDVEVIRNQMLAFAKFLLFVSLVGGVATSLAILQWGSWGFLGWLIVAPVVIVVAGRAIRGQPLGHRKVHSKAN